MPGTILNNFYIFCPLILISMRGKLLSLFYRIRWQCREVRYFFQGLVASMRQRYLNLAHLLKSPDSLPVYHPASWLQLFEELLRFLHPTPKRYSALYSQQAVVQANWAVPTVDHEKDRKGVQLVLGKKP